MDLDAEEVRLIADLSIARMKLKTLEPPFTSLTSTSVARRPIRCTLFTVSSLVALFPCLRSRIGE
jgi:hypothetical protein